MLFIDILLLIELLQIIITLVFTIFFIIHCVNCLLDVDINKQTKLSNKQRNKKQVLNEKLERKDK